MNENKKNTGIVIPRLIIKILILLLIVNYGWILIPDHALSHLSLYNTILTGRDRLPFGENPELSYNLSTFDLDAMFASHKIAKAKDKGGNYRVVLVGDSSIWGFLQEPGDTLAGLLNDEFQHTDVEFLNLGYPSISVLKDLQIIDKAVDYDPDLIIWFTTLESLPIARQTEIPFNQQNSVNVNRLIEEYSLDSTYTIDERAFDHTFWNRRRNIADNIRLQLYGFLWNATGIDQIYPESYQAAIRDFPEYSGLFHGVTEQEGLKDQLAIEIFNKTIENNRQMDFMIVNEPILISRGENSHLQYNYYYPRWAYDEYRALMSTYMQENDIKYYDFWDLVPENEFTNSAIHLTEQGEIIFMIEISKLINNHIGELQ